MKKLIFSAFLGISFCGNAQCYGDNISTTATIGAEISLTLKQDGTVWGAGYGEVLGINSSSNVPMLEKIWDGNDWAKVFAGNNFSAGIKTDGTLWTCGRHEYAQIGDGVIGNSITWIPTKVGTDTNWLTLTSTNTSVAALKTDGTLWGWGVNPNGDSVPVALVPTQIGTDTNWTKIAAGWEHIIALKSDGTLWSWGYNYYGQLGNGTNGDNTGVSSPVQIGTDSNWTEIYAGATSSFAIKSNGTIYVWGENEYYNFGDGTSQNSNVPIQISPVSDIKELAAGGEKFTIALKNDGTLWSWGKNDQAQLGLGNYSTYVATPTQIGTANNWVKVVAGANHAFAINSTGEIYSWGKSNFFELSTLDPIYGNPGYSPKSPTLIGCSLLAVNEVSNKTINIYPNPVKDILNFSEEISNIQITDISGRTVKEIPNSSKSVNLQNLSKGIYIITATTKTGKSINQKIIKQ